MQRFWNQRFHLHWSLDEISFGLTTLWRHFRIIPVPFNFLISSLWFLEDFWGKEIQKLLCTKGGRATQFFSHHHFARDEEGRWKISTKVIMNFLANQTKQRLFDSFCVHFGVAEEYEGKDDFFLLWSKIRRTATRKRRIVRVLHNSRDYREEGEVDNRSYQRNELLILQQKCFAFCKRSSLKAKARRK